MTLKNEIFEGLGAATAAQKLVYDPRDDYYDAIATAARRENERRKKQQDVYDKGTAAAANKPRGQPATGAPAGVPTRATSDTVPQPTVPGQPPTPPSPSTQTAMDTNSFPTIGRGYGIPPDLSPSAVEAPDFGSRAARGGKIPGRAIKLRYRAGGPVTPYSDEGPSDEDDDESPEAPDVPRMKPMPHMQRREQGNGGTPRHPTMPKPDDPALIRKPFDADEVWPDEEGTPEDDPDYGTPRHPHAFQRGGVVEEENPADALVRAVMLSNSPPSMPAALGGDGRGLPVPQQTREERERAIWGSNTTDRANAARDQTIANIRARRAAQPTPGEDRAETPDWPPEPAPPQPDNEMLRRPKPVFDPRPYGQEFNASDPIQADESRALMPIAPSAPGFDGSQPYAPVDPSETIGGAARKLFPPTSTPPPPSPPLGAGAGTAAGQQAAAAPGTSGPKGTTTPPAPPSGAAVANTPSTAPKGEGYQRFQPTERMAMRPDAPDWNPLGMDLRAPKGGAGAGGGGAAAGPPPRLGMSDPNRIAAFDPTPGGADMTDPTRRRTELSEALIGAATQARRGPNGELPPVGDGAISRSTGQALVQQYSYGGRMEPGEAALAGMMAGYRILLTQNRIPEANQLAYGIMQYANIEAASHAAVAADRVRAGDFLGALQGVAAAATWLPDGMKHEVGADGRSITTKDYTGKVTATTPVDGRWLLAAIEGFTNGDLLWQTLQAAADHLKATDKNAEGRALGHEIQRNTIALQRQRLGKGAGGPKGPAALTEPERKARAISASVSGVPAPQQPHLPAMGSNETDVDPAQQYSTGYDYNEQPTPQ